MVEITELPDNFIGKADRERLESFGGHTIAHGRATRWHWGADSDGNDCFEIFDGGADERLAATVFRVRKADAFLAHDDNDKTLGEGDLEHVMAALERYFVQRHGESENPSA